MKQIHWLAAALSLALLTLAGCSGGSKDSAKSGDTPAPPSKSSASVAENLAKLGVEDRKLAEAQKYCAVETRNLLGSMGVPVKVTVKDQPVFLCCEGCETRAKAHADRTLAKVRELREKNSEPKPE
jgi:hypothetical protein